MEPKRLTRAFAEEGLKNNIPDVVTESTAANAATYKKGLPGSNHDTYCRWGTAAKWQGYERRSL